MPKVRVTCPVHATVQVDAADGWLVESGLRSLYVFECGSGPHRVAKLLSESAADKLRPHVRVRSALPPIRPVDLPAYGRFCDELDGAEGLAGRVLRCSDGRFECVVCARRFRSELVAADGGHRCEPDRNVWRGPATGGR